MELFRYTCMWKAQMHLVAMQKRKAEAEMDAVTDDGSADTPACTDTGLSHEPTEEPKEAAAPSEAGEPSDPAGAHMLLLCEVKGIVAKLDTPSSDHHTRHKTHLLSARNALVQFCGDCA